MREILLPLFAKRNAVTWWNMKEKCKNIQSLYKYLEENGIDYYIHSKQIADLFRDLRDEDAIDLSIAQWEIDCFNLVAKDGELKPSGIFTNEKGGLHP